MQKRMSKKGVSVMIGYILLITGAIIISAGIYQYAKGFIPKDSIECHYDISMFVKKSECLENADGTYNLKLELKNNGLFDINGFYIRATTSEEQELAVFDLSKFVKVGGDTYNNMVFLREATTKTNTFEPGDEVPMILQNIPQKIYFVEFTPFEEVVVDNRNRFAVCTKAIFKEIVNCKDVVENKCTDTCASLGYNCGEVCGVSCGECGTTKTCIEGKCKSQ